ncbi:MAG: tetratricopeptide repeat protein [Candidatus Binataceae bacterium]
MSISRRVPLLIAVAVVMVLQWPMALYATANHGGSDEQVCDALADYYLGMEDYPEAIKRHLVVIRQHPDDALAYYHLGFAYGMMGDHRKELANYKRAVDLGLSDWQLFLNLGLLYMDAGRLEEATEVLRLATLLAPYRPETHFNLGLVYERLGMFEQAQQEVLTSLRLDPDQIDARNTLGAIYAEQGNYARAHQEWAELVNSHPDYTPARANLAILQRVESGQIKGPERVSGFARAH